MIKVGRNSTEPFAITYNALPHFPDGAKNG
jgi:hypothetical protein